MKKMIQLLAIFPLILITLMSLVGCTMKSHPIEVKIVNANKEDNIFDKKFRLGIVDETLNYIVYTSRTKKSWLDTTINQEKISKLNKEVATEFYQDFTTHSIDTFFYKFAINNNFVDQKLEFNNLNVKVIAGIAQQETDKATAPLPINFDMYFQGKENKYQFSGLINWKYIIKSLKKTEDSKKDEFVFFWQFDTPTTDLTFLKLNKVV